MILLAFIFSLLGITIIIQFVRKQRSNSLIILLGIEAAILIAIIIASRHSTSAPTVAVYTQPALLLSFTINPALMRTQPNEPVATEVAMPKDPPVDHHQKWQIIQSY